MKLEIGIAPVRCRQLSACIIDVQRRGAPDASSHQLATEATTFAMHRSSLFNSLINSNFTSATTRTYHIKAKTF